MNITAIIVARGGSVRLPGKALLPFGASTLLGHKIDTLRDCPSVSRIVVGSDSDAILAEAVAHGADPIRNNGEYPSANEMCRDMAERVAGDIALWAHPTNPLIRPETYERALAIYADAVEAGAFDSLVSVTEIKRHAWISGKPFNFDPWTVPHEGAARLKAVCFQDGAIFIQARERMVERAYFYGQSPLLFPISAVEGCDIDCAEDYRLATALYQCTP